MSATRVSEYDRFGPWIDEVLDLEDVPALFRDHAIDFDTARLVLKVPREIARRDATADMDPVRLSAGPRRGGADGSQAVRTAIDVAVPTGSTAARVLTAAANALR